MKKIVMIIMVLIVLASSFVIFNKYFINENRVENEEIENNSEMENDDINIIYEDKDRQVQDEDGTQLFEEFIRVDSQGNIDVAVFLNNISDDDDEYLVFKVMLNNHAVDLDNIDFSKITNIKTSDGLVISEGFIWKIEAGQGHHVNGSLKINKEYEGKMIIDEATTSLELEMLGLGGIESRKFIWGEDALGYINK